MTVKKIGGAKSLNRGGGGLNGPRQPSLLATNEKVRQANAARRGVPLLLGSEIKAFGVTRWPYKDLIKLKIDQTYQREEVTEKVNELIHVIKSGGQIADPITVAQRPDGTQFIVDGQQRWWAAIDCEVSLEVKLLKVPDYDSEVKLFHVLNNKAALGPVHVVRSWPGPIGDVLRDLNDNRDSPLYGEVNFKAQGSTAFPASLLMRGLYAAATGSTPRGDVRSNLQRFDYEWSHAPDFMRQACWEFAALASKVFASNVAQSMRVLSVVALGLSCHKRWKAHGFSQPKPAQVAKVAQIEWVKLIPTASTRWIPVIEAEVERAWPIKGSDR